MRASRCHRGGRALSRDLRHLPWRDGCGRAAPAAPARHRGRGRAAGLRRLGYGVHQHPVGRGRQLLPGGPPETRRHFPDRPFRQRLYRSGHERSALPLRSDGVAGAGDRGGHRRLHRLRRQPRDHTLHRRFHGGGAQPCGPDRQPERRSGAGRSGRRLQGRPDRGKRPPRAVAYRGTGRLQHRLSGRDRGMRGDHGRQCRCPDEHSASLRHRPGSGGGRAWPCDRQRRIAGIAGRSGGREFHPPRPPVGRHATGPARRPAGSAGTLKPARLRRRSDRGFRQRFRQGSWHSGQGARGFHAGAGGGFP